MCGIAGVIGSPDGVDTAAMMLALQHRGPDDHGEYRHTGDGACPVWLGHRRLAIIDPSSAGRQPMHSVCGRYTLIFNGEIYNYRELRTRLTDFQPRTRTDTEIVLELLARHGDEALVRLRGMFAIAFWDRRRSTLLLARDRQGEKPLYFFSDPNAERLLFASEVRALLASDVVPRVLDSDGLDSYLVFGAVADPYTLIRGIRSVPAGGTVTLSPEGIASRRFWSVSDIEVDQTLTRTAAVDGLAERLEIAARRCLVADVPVGVLLSGGIDSSVNVAVMAGIGTTDLRTFSVVFGGADAGMSEEVYSSLVAKRFGTRHQTCTVELEDAAGFLELAVAGMDQPSHDGLNAYAISDAIHAAGLKVAVSGIGADELLLGYPQRFRFARVLRAVSLIPSRLAGRITRYRQGHWNGRDSRWDKFTMAAGARCPASGAYLGLHSQFSHSALQWLRGEDRPHPERFVESVGGHAPLDILSRLQLRHYLKDTLIRDADQMSMANSLEVRAPFLDHDLVDFLLRVPAAHKIDAERNKPLLLDAVGERLPRQVWDRPKRGFAMPVGRWILEGSGPLRNHEIPGLDPVAVHAVRQNFATGGMQRRFRYTPVWTLDVLDAWIRRHRIGAPA